MNQILLIAHLPLASALLQAALHVLPEAQKDVFAMDIWPDVDAQISLQKAQQVLDAHQRADAGVLILTDVVGATPCNIAQQLHSSAPMALLAGVNLPMLIRALNYRQESVPQMLERASEGARRGIVSLKPINMGD